MAIGTSRVETLTSYMMRLAEAHTVSVRTLIQREIFPNLSTSPKNTHFSGLGSLNGMGTCIEKEPDPLGDAAVDLGLSGRRGHEMTAGLAGIEGHTADTNFLSCQPARRGEPDRISGDPRLEIVPGTVGTSGRPAGFRLGHRWKER